MQWVQKFVKALSKPSRSDLTPLRAKEVFKLQDIDSLFSRYEGVRSLLCFLAVSTALPGNERSGIATLPYLGVLYAGCRVVHRRMYENLRLCLIDVSRPTPLPVKSGSYLYRAVFIHH